MSIRLDIATPLCQPYVMAILLPHPLSGLFDDRRARVLDVLLSESPLSGREIARRAGLSPTTACAALDDLHERGMVTVAPRGRALIWSLAEDSAIVQVFREFLETADREAGQSVLDELGEEPVAVVVFGSVARGDASIDSDIDVLVVAPDGDARRRYLRRTFRVARRLQRLLGQRVEVIVLDIEQLNDGGSFARNVAREGRTLVGTSIEDLVAA